MKEEKMKTIVVGYDDSEGAARALQRTAELAQAFDAKVIVTSVASALSPAVAAHGNEAVDPVDPPELHRAQLEHAARALRDSGIVPELELRLGDPAREIVELADAHDADLIVVGSRNIGLLEHLVSPSVGNAVSRKAHRDVLVVH
jgi:nucleotide-binding universal stress UspA family protein